MVLVEEGDEDLAGFGPGVDAALDGGGEGEGFGVGEGGFDAGSEGAHDVCLLVCEGFAGFGLEAGSGCQKGEESADVCRGDAASAGGAGD